MSLNKILQQTGQFPSIGIKLIPLDQSLFAKSGANYQDINNFLDYRFHSSVVNPVANFSFQFAMPNYSAPFSQYIHEGDQIILYVNILGQEVTLATGLIDTIETEVTASGETVSVMGRDLLGQWDDQCIFTPDGNVQVLAAQMSPQALYTNLSQNTRTPALRVQGIPSAAYNIGFSPQESKLQVVTRYLEPYNALVWCDPDGTMVFGKPNMAQASSGTIMVNKSQGVSNCLSIRSTRSAATIPNFVIPIFSSQTIAANQISKRQGVANPQPGPKRLASLGHYLHRVLVVSDPQGDTPQQMNFVQSLIATGGNPIDRCRAYAQRDIARENMREIIIQAVVPGHINETGIAYQKDQVYRVNYDRDGIDEAMYLYECEYTLDSQGPKTLLWFTRMNSIVAGNNFQ